MLLLMAAAIFVVMFILPVLLTATVYGVMWILAVFSYVTRTAS